MRNTTYIRPMDDEEYRQAGFNLCPDCRADQVGFGAPHSCANRITLLASCTVCGCRWTLKYELAGYSDLRKRTGEYVPHDSRPITFDVSHESAKNRAEPTRYPWTMAGYTEDLIVILGPYEARGVRYDDGLIASMTSAFPPGETRANARLITAAPKLYAGCRHLAKLGWLKGPASGLVREALDEIENK